MAGVTRSLKAISHAAILVSMRRSVGWWPHFASGCTCVVWNITYSRHDIDSRLVLLFPSHFVLKSFMRKQYHDIAWARNGHALLRPEISHEWLSQSCFTPRMSISHHIFIDRILFQIIKWIFWDVTWCGIVCRLRTGDGSPTASQPNRRHIKRAFMRCCWPPHDKCLFQIKSWAIKRRPTARNHIAPLGIGSSLPHL